MSGLPVPMNGKSPPPHESTCHVCGARGWGVCHACGRSCCPQHREKRKEKLYCADCIRELRHLEMGGGHR